MTPTAWNPALVLVAGATGGTGREIVRGLHAAGIPVRGLTSRPEKRPQLEAMGVREAVAGDLMDPAGAARAAAGADAVLCAVGSGGNPMALLPGGPSIHGVGTIHLIEAAKAAGVLHFVLETSIGVGNSAGAASVLLRMALAHVFREKDRAERALRASGLVYTIFRPGRLTNDPATGDVLVGERGTFIGTIPRADVARLMVAALFTPEARNRTFEIVSRAGVRGKPGGLVSIDWQLP